MEKLKKYKNKIKKEYPHGINLYNVDYNSSLDEHGELIEKSVSSKNGIEILEEEVWDWYSGYDCLDDIYNQVFTSEELEEIREDEDLQQKLNDYIYNQDTSNPLKDLLKNTRERYFYYDLNYYVSDTEDLKKFCKKFGIDYNVALSIYNDSFGCGQAVILFWNDIESLLEEGDTIKFNSDCQLGFIDRGSGSGWSDDLKQELKVNFVRENLHDDEGDSGYSFTGDVCGMVGGSMGSAEITKEKTKKTIKENETQKEYREREEKYQKIFDDGKCSFCDMKFTRHRNVEYINDFPCGNKCKDCGTFWID